MRTTLFYPLVATHQASCRWQGKGSRPEYAGAVRAPQSCVYAGRDAENEEVTAVDDEAFAKWRTLLDQEDGVRAPQIRQTFEVVVRGYAYAQEDL